MSDLLHLLALTSIDDVGPVRIKRLINIFGSPEDVLKRSYNDLLSIDGIGAIVAKKISSFQKWGEVEKRIEECASRGIKIIKYDDPFYNASLKEIPDSPLVYYLKGEINEDDNLAVAVVGPRKPTEYGVRVAEMIAGDLAGSGMTIVSGMARGIDTVSHRASLKRDGRTIAVLGSGLDIPYPPENAGLMKRIEENGSVISEYPLGTMPDGGNFPRRNRIISGLSLGVLVIEAAADSGTLITARLALEQGREVFAVPGMITSSRSSGTNHLIKDGARLVQSARDIIEELAPQLRGYLKAKRELRVELTVDERTVVEGLSSEPAHIDSLARQIKMPAQQVLSLLTGLELKGVVKQAKGKKFYIE